MSIPFSREEEKALKIYCFTPIDTLQGRIFISVTYLENLPGFNLETSSTFRPHIVADDVVGSPDIDPFTGFE